MYKTLPATREQEEAIDIFQSQHASFFLKPNFSAKEKNVLSFYGWDVFGGTVEEINMIVALEQSWHECFAPIALLLNYKIWDLGHIMISWVEKLVVKLLISRVSRVNVCSYDIYHFMMTWQRSSDVFWFSFSLPVFLVMWCNCVQWCCVWARCCHPTSLSHLMSGENRSHKRAAC